MLLPLLASVCAGLAVTVLLWWTMSALATEDLEQGAEWRYDVSRMNELRRLYPSYRAFQPVIRFLGRLNRAAVPRSLPEIQRQFLAAGKSRCWLPEEYLARLQLFALFIAPVYFYLCIDMMGPAGAILAILLTVLTAWLLRRRLANQAARRLVQIKRRMPYLLDLLTLLMEAGATFLQALRQACHELRGSPVATEFGCVLADMNLGKTRREAFETLRSRLADDEITAIVGAILQGEELGTPLARTFRIQADVLRLKRSQRAETIAGEAGVNMLLPGVLVMAATILVIFGPFVLNYLYSGLGF